MWIGPTINLDSLAKEDNTKRHAYVSSSAMENGTPVWSGTSSWKSWDGRSAVA